MLNLRLTNPDDRNDKTEEFYVNENPAKFLAGFKELNIIVGANNTRKSRFMRSIIKISHKVNIRTPLDINQTIYDSREIIAELKTIQPEYQSGLIRFGSFYSKHHDTNVLTTYFDKVGKAEKTITCEEIIKLIESVIDNYLSILSDGAEQETLISNLNALNVLSKALLYLFQHFKDKQYVAVHKNSYPEGPFQNMIDNFPGRPAGTPIEGIEDVLAIARKIDSWSSNFKEIEVVKSTQETIYIPALRTSRQLSGSGSALEQNDIFEKTIRENYFTSDSIKVKIDTGMKLYERINYARNGTREEIRNFHAFEKFIGETFFGSHDIHIIPYRGKHNEKDYIRISIPGEIENVPMHDLGEGVQAIINLLFPVFTASDNQWVFIDEPENNLHPGFQNIFIKAITQNEYLKKKKLRYFINTHSNHILSESFLSGADTAIFVFSKRDEFSSNISHFAQNEFQTLELLGVMNTSVLITNCSIWVEGVTDRFYLRAFLLAYCNQAQISYVPNEGYDFSFVEYGGKNLVHYDFDQKPNDNIAAYFINSNVFLLADNDLDEARKEKYQKIRRKNFRYEQTDLPEIENILPEKILKDFLIKEVKCDEASVTKIFPIKDQKAKLGAIFDGVTKKTKLVPIQAKNGGTLEPRYKSKLSQFVYNNIVNGTYTWNDLQSSRPLKRIVEELYSFIKSKSRDSK